MTTTTIAQAKLMAQIALQSYTTHKKFTVQDWLLALSMTKNDELVKQEYKKIINRA